MSNETLHSEPLPPARRRIVAPSERRVALPVALIAHEGAQRDEIESQISLTRPVVTFPSLAHFDADSAGRERWAGVVVARSHAWDARLDTCVPRRAFIALYGLSEDEEGYGWPDAVKRVGTREELADWLTAVAAPVLPPDDRPRVVKPRSKRSTFTMSLAGDPIPVRNQLSLLPAEAPATKTAAAKATKSKTVGPAAQLQLPVSMETRSKAAPTAKSARAKHLQNTGSVKSTPRSQPRAKAGVAAKPRRPSSAIEHAKRTGRPKTAKPQTAAKASRKQDSAATRRNASKGLRLTSSNAQEQAFIEAVRRLGAEKARSIVEALERFERG